MIEFLKKYKAYGIGVIFTASIGWITNIYLTEKGLHEWYDAKQNSKAMGLRLNKETKEVTCVSKDGEEYHAYYVDSLDCYVYDYKGKQFKCY